MTPGLVPTNPVLTTFCSGLCIFYDKINCLLLKSINTLIVLVFVCLYPINNKTAQPIRPIFCVGPHMTPGNVYGCSKLQKMCVQKFLIFVKFQNYLKIHHFFFSFRLYKETMLFHLDLLNQAKNILVVLQSSSVKVWDKSVKRFLSSDRTFK